MTLLLLLIGTFAFSWLALNLGEQKMARPGVARPLTITLIVLAAYLAWPLYAGLVQWAIPTK